MQISQFESVWELPMTKTYLNCGKELSTKGKYCDNTCQNEYQYKELVKTFRS